MRELYDQLSKIGAMDDLATRATLGDHLGKMTEEVGEFAKEANKLNGRKRKGIFESNEDIVEKLRKEAGDAMQCIMVIAASAGVSYDGIVDALRESNTNYQAWVDEKVKKLENV
jgi:NTP pyrophosphatase (non-canonical NTP hydrolase)